MSIQNSRTPNYYQYVPLSLAAGEIRTFNIYGRYISLLGIQGNTQNIRVKIQYQPEQEFPAGVAFELPRQYDENGNLVSFTVVEFRNADAVPVTIQFAASEGIITDNRFNPTVVVPVSLSGNTFITPAAVAVLVAGGVILAANTSRKTVIIQNTGVVDIWVGDSNVDPSVNRGIKVTVGATIFLDTTAVIYGRALAVAGQVTIGDLR